MKLRELRKKAGYTQQKVADAVGVSRSAVAMWESGTDCGIEMATKLAALFHVSTDYLLDSPKTYPDNGAAHSPEDDAFWSLRESVRRDPERRELFNLVRNADIEQVRQAVAIIDALKRASGGENNETP